MAFGVGWDFRFEAFFGRKGLSALGFLQQEAEGKRQRPGQHFVDLDLSLRKNFQIFYFQEGLTHSSKAGNPWLVLTGKDAGTLLPVLRPRGTIVLPHFHWTSLGVLGPPGLIAHKGKTFHQRGCGANFREFFLGKKGFLNFNFYLKEFSL